MPYSALAKNVMLDSLGALITHISLHSANPGATGASEISGGTPAYARQAPTWNAASAGSKTISNTPDFNVPAATTVSHVGLWGGASGAVAYYGYVDVTDEAFAAQGTYEVISGTIDLNATASA